MTQRVAYTYDAFDRRIGRQLDADGNGVYEQADRYVYDLSTKPDPATGVPLGDIVLTFTDSDGDGPGAASLSHRILHGPGIDQPLAIDAVGGAVQWLLADNLGTVRDVVEYNAGTNTTSVVNHLTYNAFGVLTGETNPAAGSAGGFAFSYTGREWDAATGLNYYRARWYDPQVGRFLSEDPLGFAAQDVNLSRYVENGPTNAIDPSGLMPNQEDCINYHTLLERIREIESKNRNLTPRDVLSLLRREVVQGITTLPAYPLGWKYLLTRTTGFVDLGHFVNSAEATAFMIAAGLPPEVASATVDAAGIMQEINQLRPPPVSKGGPPGVRSSAFTFEDIPSNRLGIDFGKTLRMNVPLSTQLQSFLESQGAVDPRLYPGLIGWLPITENEHERLYQVSGDRYIEFANAFMPMMTGLYLGESTHPLTLPLINLVP